MAEKNPHILGFLRIPLIHIVSIGVLLYIGATSENWARAGIFFLIALAVTWIVTTEFFIKLSISVIVAGIAGVILFYTIKAGFPNFLQNTDIDSFRENREFWTGAVAVIPAFFVGFFVYHFLDKSSWIGSPCPSCKTRGKLQSEEIDKQFLGRKTQREIDFGVPSSEGAKYNTFNLYQVTVRHICNACSHEWITTHEKKETA